jgi:hypothetical protein
LAERILEGNLVAFLSAANARAYSLLHKESLGAEPNNLLRIGKPVVLVLEASARRHRAFGESASRPIHSDCRVEVLEFNTGIGS